MTQTQWQLTEELALEVSHATSEDSLFAALSRAAERMGFDRFALAYDRRGSIDPASVLVHNYPEAWAKVYVGFDLGGADPVRRAGERSMTGFQWRHLADYIPLTRGDRQMLDVGRENGIADGYTIPRHLPGEASGTCSFVIGRDRPLPRDILNCAEIVGAIALTATRQFIGTAPPKARPVLSERQRECVLWTARGKTAAEVAAILGISEVTVVQHLKTARERYDVHCRQMLILCALFDGLIGFSDIFDWWSAR
jgi:LuxR family quorum-sensing system transcriptional regulator CciR